MSWKHSWPTLGASLVLACGGGSGLDRNQPADELGSAARRDLCAEALWIQSDPEYVDDTCVYAAYDDMTDPEMCFAGADECRAFVGGALTEDELAELCSDPTVQSQFDCHATVGEILDCTDAYNATIQEFMAQWDCANASPDPVPDPPVVAEIPDCMDVIPRCPELRLTF